MKLATIGAGMLASAIQRALPETVILGHDVVDVTSQDSIVAALREHRPDVVIYVAAIHKLLDAEKNPTLAMEVNARGVGRVARLVPTLFVSTDYVFGDGGPHDEALPGREPRSAYGRTKRAGEIMALENDGIVVRVSGLFDGEFQSRKGVSFPEMVAQSYDPLRLPSDQVFSPTYAPDAADRIAHLTRALVGGERHIQTAPDDMVVVGGIYHAANQGSVSWADFATHIRQRMGRPRMKVTPFVANDPLRPTNSSLRSTRLMPLPSWVDGIDRWMVARQRHLEETREVSPLRGNAAYDPYPNRNDLPVMDS